MPGVQVRRLGRDPVCRARLDGDSSNVAKRLASCEMPAKSEMSVRRLKFLDGLRGWGAVVVLIYHVFCDGLPVDAAIGERLRYFVPFNGTLAVLIFFAVSGFSLSVRYLADGDVRSWLRIAAGRYLRLAIPIFAACLVVHIVMVCGFVDAPAERLAKFSGAFNFAPTMGHLLKFSLFDVFFNYSAQDTYIGPLWTMSVELIGSFVVLLAIVVVRPLPSRLLFLSGLTCLILWLAPTETTAMLALFPAGAGLAEGFNRGWIDALPKSAGVLLLSIGCLAPVVLPYSVGAWGLIGTLPLVLGCMVIPGTRNWLSGTVSAHLGRISFPLYLMHGPVLCFIGEPLTRYVGDALLLKVLIQFAVVVLSFVSAYAFLPVNEFAIGLAHRFAKWVTNPFFVSPTPAEP
jgi:peptidoglycan/LPS O-acetylase OafA/YrhL